MDDQIKFLKSIGVTAINLSAISEEDRLCVENCSDFAAFPRSSVSVVAVSPFFFEKSSSLFSSTRRNLFDL